MKRPVLLLVVAVLSLTACSGGAASTTTVPGSLDTGAPTTTAVPQADEVGTREGSLGVPVVENRQVIYDGTISLEATDTRRAFERILLLVETSGGYLASSQVGEAAEGEQPAIYFTVRVPVDRLTATMAEIRAVSDRVVSESLNSQDVTDQFVDIEAQLRNLYALEGELLALLTELRDNPAADPAKLLAVFDQIRITRGEIEQLEGRKQMLTNLVALATITLTVTPAPWTVPIVPSDPVWEPATVAKEALRSLIETLQVVGTAVIRLFLYVLPVLALIVAPFAALSWWLYRRNRRPKVAYPQSG